MFRVLAAISLLALALLAGCETLPRGPTVTAQPGSGRSPEDFRADDAACRQYASTADHRSVHVTGVGQGSVIDGTDSAQYAGIGMQQSYNRAYVRCMYLKGNAVPLLARERWPAPRSTWPPDRSAYFLPLQD